MIRVLIIDDHEMVRLGYSAYLSIQDDIEVVGEAENGLIGYEMALDLRPDIILMDVVMPELNGYQATRKLLNDKETAHIPVIMISSKTQESDRFWGLRQGARAYVCKPAVESELEAIINEFALKH